MLSQLLLDFGVGECVLLLLNLIDLFLELIDLDVLLVERVISGFEDELEFGLLLEEAVIVCAELGNLLAEM